MKLNKIPLFSLLALTAGAVNADTIFTDDFQDGNINGWASSGNGSATASAYNGNYSLRVNRTKSATANISTLGYNNVNVYVDLAAYSLERTDMCYAEASTNGGASWSTLVSIANGNDNSSFYSYNGPVANADNNADFQLRVRSAGNRNNDYCYLDNVFVQGTPNTGPVTSPEISVSGSGTIGDVELGASASTVFTVTNVGDAALTINSVTGISQPFTISTDSCSATAVNAGASCAITVNFTPTATGAFTDAVNINSNDSEQANLAVGVSGTGTQQDPVNDCTFDCLSGDGNVSRSTVTYANLTGNAGNGSLVDFDGFALPAGAANPSNSFEGSLTFNSVQRGWTEINDPYLYDTLTGVKQLPNFNYAFVQHGTHIIPQQRGLIESASALGQWDLILEPGRVWDENSDNGYSRVAIPFALVEYNQNCTHNGVMSFLFNDAGDISNVQYQIASETCAYYQFNMYGRLAANYNDGAVPGASNIKSAYETEVSDRMTTKPISALASDFPNSGININNIAGDQDAADLSSFGVVYNNIHYVGGCETRYGTYPFCDVLSLPSYSTAKSTVGALSLMRLEQKFSGAKDASVRDYVSECTNNTKWANVTLEDALDMATGNYDSTAYEADEVNYAATWLYSNTHSEKANISCNFYDHKEDAGQRWVYHSSDTYLVARGVNSYLQNQQGVNQEYFTDLLVAEVFAPLGLSPSTSQSIRTRDNESAAVAALGLFYHRDDVVKLADFINNKNGVINGAQILNANMLNAALQRTPSDRGLPTDPSQTNVTSYYNNSFWAYDLNASTVMDNCNTETWIPYMSGYGGIGIQLLPNGMTYYFFSDGFDYSFTTTLNELDKISSICN